MTVLVVLLILFSFAGLSQAHAKQAAINARYAASEIERMGRKGSNSFQCDCEWQAALLKDYARKLERWTW